MRLIRAFRENVDPSYGYAIIVLISSLLYLVILLIQIYGIGGDIHESHKRFYFWFSIYYALIAISSLVLLLYRPSLYEGPYGPLLPLVSVSSAFFAAQLFFIEPIFDISATIALEGVLILFVTKAQHSMRLKLTYYIFFALVNIIVYYMLNPICAYLQTTATTHGTLSQISFVLIIASTMAYAIYFFSKIGVQREALIIEQTRLIEEVKQAQVEAEARRLEAEARYAQAQQLQKELSREVARTALTARYEALMRDQYGKPLPHFLRALLEYLQDDLNFVAGLAYQVKGETYEVIATFALPEYQGRTFSGGLLQTATTLQAPYLVAIPPITLPLHSLATLKPQYALYLPISAEVAQGKVVALIELLFLNQPDPEKIAIIGELLPRLGTFVWIQSENPNIHAKYHA